MFYRILAALLISVVIYVAYEMISSQRTYNAIYTPPTFMAMNADTGTIPIVQFLDFHCDVCKDNARVVMDYAERNPDILFIIRPVYSTGAAGYSEVRTVIATGMQDRYWETMRTIIMHDGVPDEAFYKENAALMDIDFEQLAQDSQSETAQRMTDENTKAANLADFKSTQSLMVGPKIYYLQKPLTESDLSQIVETARQSR